MRLLPSIRLILVLPLALAGVGLLAACAAAPKEPDTRVIGLDLWAGDVAVAGIAQPQLNVVQGTRSITGPTAWTSDKTSQTLQVYERRNVESEGVKSQYFTVRSDGQALGRAFDSRPGVPDRYFANDAFFPLGTWARGESRSFQLIEYTDKGPQTRIATIKMRRLDFVFRDVPHSLRYDWTLTDANGNVLYDERYVYSPGVGFASFQNRLK